ncbi:transposase-like zinc-binding domain-containing protein [Burkholderia ubonensis]|uniref:IS1/IS1595 family N-terminal zinc-binding domain-containing protein n=1 Tax=Burkholderia ubonensis TaxID=101571 RepID=UPI0039F4ED61
MLLNDYDDIHAPMHGPTACPACGSVQVRTKGISGELPRYQCSLCRKQFNRRTGHRLHAIVMLRDSAN